MSTCILVPSKLMDLEGHELSGKDTVPTCLQGADLYAFFQMLNDVKKEFLYGTEDEQEHLVRRESEYKLQLGLAVTVKSPPVSSQPGLISSNDRSMSSVSEYGSGSSSSSNGSPPDTPETVPTKVGHLALALAAGSPGSIANLAATLRGHMRGIHDALHELAAAADYISTRYQQDIEPQSSSPCASSEEFMYRR